MLAIVLGLWLVSICCGTLAGDLLIGLSQLNNQLSLLTNEIPQLHNKPVVINELGTDPLIQEFNSVLKHFPASQHKYINKETEEGQRAIKSIFECLQSIAKQFKLSIRYFKDSEVIATIDDVKKALTFYTSDGKSLVHGKSRSGDLKHFHTSSAGEGKAFVDRLKYDHGTSLAYRSAAYGEGNIYKIHLMPFKNDFPQVLYELVKKMIDDKAFAQRISDFKFYLLEPKGEEGIPPVPSIVVYPQDGKESAQYVLNTLYELFKDVEGLDIKPRWNEKVTSLIWWAQGNGDDKKKFRQYFEEGDDAGNGRVCFVADFTGRMENYPLINPNPTLQKHLTVEQEKAQQELMKLITSLVDYDSWKNKWMTKDVFDWEKGVGYSGFQVLTLRLKKDELFGEIIDEATAAYKKAVIRILASLNSKKIAADWEKISEPILSRHQDVSELTAQFLQLLKTYFYKVYLVTGFYKKELFAPEKEITKPQKRSDWVYMVHERERVFRNEVAQEWQRILRELKILWEKSLVKLLKESGKTISSRNDLPSDKEITALMQNILAVSKSGRNEDQETYGTLMSFFEQSFATLIST